MITLYQMPVSHYCEKIRWALLAKRLPHKCVNLLPGLHIKKAMKMSGQSSLPIIKEGKNIVVNSSDILDYLDKEFPRFRLTPQSQALASQAREWERWADDDIGPAIRVLAYSALLDHPDVLIPVLAQGGPWYGAFVMKKNFPKIKHALTKTYKINSQNIELSKQVLHRATEKQLSAQAKLEPLVGGAFSRADLAVASLWAPFFQIGEFGIDWPGSTPEAYLRFSEEFAVVKPWVMHIYAKYRS